MDWFDNYWALLGTNSYLLFTLPIILGVLITLILFAILAGTHLRWQERALSIGQDRALYVGVAIVISVFFHTMGASCLLGEPPTARIAELADALRDDPKYRTLMAIAIDRAGFNTSDHFSTWRLEKTLSIYDDLIDEYEASLALALLGMEDPYAKAGGSKEQVRHSKNGVGLLLSFGGHPRK